jgi:hypothetical protein
MLSNKSKSNLRTNKKYGVQKHRRHSNVKWLQWSKKRRALTVRSWCNWSTCTSIIQLPTKRELRHFKDAQSVTLFNIFHERNLSSLSFQIKCPSLRKKRLVFRWISAASHCVNNECGMHKLYSHRRHRTYSSSFLSIRWNPSPPTRNSIKSITHIVSLT